MQATDGILSLGICTLVPLPAACPVNWVAVIPHQPLPALQVGSTLPVAAGTTVGPAASSESVGSSGCRHGSSSAALRPIPSALRARAKRGVKLKEGDQGMDPRLLHLCSWLFANPSMLSLCFSREQLLGRWLAPLLLLPAAVHAARPPAPAHNPYQNLLRWANGDFQHLGQAEYGWPAYQLGRNDVWLFKPDFS